MPAAQKNNHADARGNALRHQRCHCCAHHAVPFERAIAKDEQRIEAKIEDYRGQYDKQRHAGLADAAHQ